MREPPRSRSQRQSARRAHEFESFVAGTAVRLLRTATLLTAEEPAHNPRARRLLAYALAHTYAVWDRLHDDDPYDHARALLALRFARTAWYPRQLPRIPRLRTRRTAAPPAGVLAALRPQERLILTLRMYEGVAEEQCAALLALPPERVGEICDRACANVLHPARGSARGAGAGPGTPRGGTEAALP
ncbi:RNA polymerase subunit sigma-70 [Streptomyces sp. NA04227]|uniref:RNA polymerase subunit sigma-70 n=1 Tax=Streptomyces sp. NA04227 TaxID=2742136 RepID=UPI0015911B02|nr:RNA polymerase subunit sigma-70 [Streptomyces sp. NA04227]QKW08831.1 RNA polymerase subunit sigma-70 [Streptomyces sp. NA04227]